jgi:transposase
MSKLHLNARQQRHLHYQLRSARTARLYRRTLALVEMAQGKPVVHVARSLGVSRRSLYYWQQRYTAQHDPTALRDHKGSGRPRLWTLPLQALLEQSLAQKPDQYGYQASEWTVPLLIEHVASQGRLRVSDATMRRQLRRMGYVWKRPRYVLQPDPAREKKARNSSAAAPAGTAPRRAL